MPKQKPLTLKRKNGLYLANAGVKGRGVFCRTAINAGEILEITPTIILNDKDTEAVSDTLLNDYVFTVGEVTKRMKQRTGVRRPENSSSVIFGLISFCNHSEEPNAEVVWEERGNTIYHYLRATRKIPKNTEICTTYGEGWFDDRK